MTTPTTPAAPARRRFTLPAWLRRPGWLPRWAGRVLAGLAIAAAGFILGARLAATTTQLDVAVQQRDAAAVQAVQAADPVLALCDDPTPVGDALRADPRDPCKLALQVQATPVPPVRGDAGPVGAPGRGITGTSISPDGHLIVAFTDGTSQDVGSVVGRQGPAGRGIATIAITAGRLVITYTDGQTADVGPVVGADGKDGTNGQNGDRGADGDQGPAGRGIADVAQVDGRLVITFTDGTTQDAGPLPVPPPGPACPPGETPQVVTYGLPGGPTGTSCVAS